MDGRQIDDQLTRDGYTVRRVDVAGQAEGHLAQLLEMAETSVDKVSAKKRPSFYAQINQRLVKVDTAEFQGRSFSPSRFLTSQKFKRLAGVKDLAESLREHQTLDNPVIVYCASSGSVDSDV